MTVTRTQAGKTPRKTQHPGYVETPVRKSRTRNPGSTALHPDYSATPATTRPIKTSKGSERLAEDTVEVVAEDSPQRPKAIRPPNGYIAKSAGSRIPTDGSKKGTNPRVDDSGHFEFGGSWGVSVMMIAFPMLMYYMWIGATYSGGRLPTPLPREDLLSFTRRMGRTVYAGAFPSLRAWTIYWTFFFFEAACYLLLPGIYTKGKPLPHAGNKQLSYYCSAVWSFYTTLAVAAVLHVTRVFKLDTIIDEFGPLMSVAIISGFIVSIVAYVSAVLRRATHRMTGYTIYDFFMGAELNPRMFGLLDFKMFFEVRLPWYILLLVSIGTAARQYEQFGYVSGEVAFLCMAHFLYANACSKGEECIVPTWDIYYEKWGFMLIFWNLAGVPLSYCHCTIYLANHDPAVYRWNRTALAALFVLYLFVYWIWDTTNSQKNRFKAQLTGHDIERKGFPQLPWQTVRNPKTIASDNGDVIFVDGWYAYARKIHYTCDLFFALSWAAVTGFKSPFPWFYPVFFACMITHRAFRDIQRCRAKYGKAWLEYEKRVPYLFIPYVI